MAMRLNKNVEKLDVYKPAEPYSKVSIYVGVDQNGDEVYYTAGDDSGKELLIECPWGTSTMASVLLAKIGGYAYNGYDAKKVILNPAAELGDAVNVDGVASRIYTQKTNFDALYSSDIAAPPNEEIDDDYTYYSPDIKAVRKLATTVATLRVNVDSIEAEVTGKIDDQEAQTLIKAALNNITLSVSTGSNTNTSKITLTGDGISAVSDNITLTANSINLNTATVTGTLAAERITALNKDLTLLANSTGTDVDTTDILWFGPHTLQGTLTSPTTLKGSFMRSYVCDDSHNKTAGINFFSGFIKTGTDRTTSMTLEASYFIVNTMKDNEFGGLYANYDESGIDQYNSSTNKRAEIKLKNGEITFTNANGSCTLSQILAAI